MPKVRLSGRITGVKDPQRKSRARLLYRLFQAGWDIYNGNGDQAITLSNIQKKIVESDAFVFTPGAGLEDIFKASSIFVGFQTQDPDLQGKPAVLQNNDESWNGLLALIEHMHDLGTVAQHYSDFLHVVRKPKEVVRLLQKYRSGEEEAQGITASQKADGSVEAPEPEEEMPHFNVCVFCSASIQDAGFLEQGYKLGQQLAMQGWGCVSGAGSTGIMGQVVAGSVSKAGWCGGSNVPHIIEMEGLPEGLVSFWPRPDIYTRMEVMIEHSDAFVIMPGGMGTLQEVLALVLLKQAGDPMMQGKPIYIWNMAKEGKGHFWQPLIGLLTAHGFSSMVQVIEQEEALLLGLKEAASTQRRA